MTDSATDTPDPSKSKAKLGTLRALWPFVRQHAGLFAAWLCALALASAATLSFPVAFKQMIDGGFHSGGMNIHYLEKRIAESRESRMA